MDSIDKSTSKFSLFSLSGKEVEIKFAKPVHMEMPIELVESIEDNNNVTKELNNETNI